MIIVCIGIETCGQEAIRWFADALNGKGLNYLTMRKQEILRLRWRSAPIYAIVFAALVLFSLNGCEKGRVNPLDLGGTDFQSPGLTILTGPAANSILTTDSVQVLWTGNTGVNIYSFTLTNMATRQVYAQSNSWTSDTSVTLRYLDDSPYEFIVKTKYNGFNDETDYSAKFTVQTHALPTLVFMRKFTTVTVGQQFEIDVWGEDIQGLFAGDISVGFAPSSIQLVGLSEGDLHDSSGVDQMTLLDYTQPDQIGQANRTGIAKISTFMLARSTQGNATLSGTGSILKLFFIAIQSGQSDVTFVGTDLRDYNGDILSIPTAGTAIVSVTGGR